LAIFRARGCNFHELEQGLQQEQERALERRETEGRVHQRRLMWSYCRTP